MSCRNASKQVKVVTLNFVILQQYCFRYIKEQTLRWKVQKKKYKVLDKRRVSPSEYKIQLSFSNLRRLELGNGSSNENRDRQRYARRGEALEASQFHFT